ncbi:nuclear transport factor 2 family protein [Pedobacter frigiditerrae]|uniref:Nuclear transport factor 2 family protein n=1 Tax=Pedobacter frigiditerrae TaxID=2530452 RepID=A0A4R0N157_9SPHI|nr:nuclear transport factor 2 family protein [Pedobacter frigiditerrae]TCC93489.1 nuclear transport factor 2 family protein [Pedobacter frigiditerrae]
MIDNEQLIHNFYTSFKNKDYKGMQASYADNAIFSDAVFKNLNSEQVKAMWEMLVVKGKDMRLEFSRITANENSVTAHWDAYYTFSATGKKVVNKIDAIFEIENGKIIKHTDSFNFHTWSTQALGIKGFLLGWTPFLRKKVAAQAMKNLASFMKTKY